MPELKTDVSISGVLDGFRRRLRGILFAGGVGILLYLLWDIAQLFLIAAIVATSSIRSCAGSKEL